MPRSKKATALTAERGPVHGNFAEGASVTQGVMGIFQGTSRWPSLSPARREAIHMIVHKLHRIVTGNPNHPDHWDDIAGYAHLGATDGVSGEVPAALAAATRRRPRAKTKKVKARPTKRAKAVVKKKPTANRRTRPAKSASRPTPRPLPRARSTSLVPEAA